MAEKKKRFAYASEVLVEPSELPPRPEQEKQPKRRGRPAAGPKKSSKLEQSEVLSEQKLIAEPAKRSGEQARSPVAALQLGNLEAMLAPPQRRGKRDTAGEGRMAAGREQLNVRITPELKRAACAVAALKGMTLGDVVEQALIEYIQREQQER